MQTNKDNIHKNTKILYYGYKVGNKVMLKNKPAWKEMTPYINRFEINQDWTNVMIKLQIGATIYIYIYIYIYNIHQINPYKTKTDVDDVHT